MSGFLLFLRKIYVVILFIIIEGIAIYYYVNSDIIRQSNTLSFTSNITSGVSSLSGGVRDYFSLRGQNRELLSRVIELEQQLNVANSLIADDYQLDSLTAQLFQREGYNYVPARVISNSINKSNNFITINAGRSDGISENMAVITPSGDMVGYISSCSEHYSVAISVLSRSFKSSGKLANDNYFGSIWWSGDNRYKLNLSELSKYALLQHGDTIVTTGFSQIFPAGITIGRISDFSLDELGTSYEVEVELSADLSALNRVVVVGREDVLFVNPNE
ncbi:MAG: rod shape-determining protein MreC [Rikenellaceae bacterium]